MYSPKRRMRLFRDPAWASGPVVIDDSTVYTYSWAEQTGAPSQRYATFAVDDTGDVMMSARWDGTDGQQGPYISTDTGANWTREVTGMTFGANSTTQSVAIARSNPDIMYVPVVQSRLYKSTDRGSNWSAITGSAPFDSNRTWLSVACSSDGSNVVAAISSSNIFKSTDGGSNWTTLSNAGSRAWDDLIISDDGQVIAGCAFNNYIYVSTDGGDTWSSNTGEGSRLWRGLSASADGRVLFASAVTSGGAWLSTDTGETWTNVTSSVGGTGDYFDTATSINGAKLVVARTTGPIYISQDSGTTWDAQSVPGSNKTWDGIGMSPDGKTIVVGRNTGRPWVATGT